MADNSKIYSAGMILILVILVMSGVPLMHIKTNSIQSYTFMPLIMFVILWLLLPCYSLLRSLTKSL